jgi:transcription initiation factor TFIIIB Brf1 subunit/transcription initiation factor TFIIB
MMSLTRGKSAPLVVDTKCAGTQVLSPTTATTVGWDTESCCETLVNRSLAASPALTDAGSVYQGNPGNQCNLENPEWDNFMREFTTCDTDIRIEFGATRDIPDATCEVDERIIDYKSCPTCRTQCVIDGNALVCQSCGYELTNLIEAQSDFSVAAQECSGMSSVFVPLKLVGCTASRYTRSVYLAAANYGDYAKNKNFKEMVAWSHRSKGRKLPKNVIRAANEMFHIIKQHGYVFRVNCKRGVMGECLYYACNAHGISKTPGEIADIVGIEEKFLSYGDRVLQDLNEKRIITIPTNIDPIRDYTVRYLDLLDIDPKYVDFVVDLINTAERKRIHILHDSRNNTKAAGAVYILVCRIPKYKKLINTDMIEQRCNISKTTFKRYADVIVQYHRVLTRVFKRHRIPMPDSWRVGKKTTRIIENISDYV